MKTNFECRSCTGASHVTQNASLLCVENADARLTGKLALVAPVFQPNATNLSHAVS